MRVTTAALSALLLSVTLARPLRIMKRQSQMDEDGVLLSPTNGTSLTAGSTMNFQYTCDNDDDDDDQCRQISVALVQIIPIVTNLPVENGRIAQEIELPANLTAGEYLLAIDEQDDEDVAESNREPDWDFEHDVPSDDGDGDTDERKVYLTIVEG